MSKAYVGNAADRKQVGEAKRKEKDRRKQEREDLQALLALPEGRRFLWRLLTECKVFGSIWEGSAKIHYNAGQQDFGHFLLAEIGEADEDALCHVIFWTKEDES